MNLTLPTSFTKEAELRNASLKPDEATWTAESLAQHLLNKAGESYAADQEAKTLNAMAENKELVQIGIEVSAAAPEIQVKAFEAARKVIADNQ